MLESDPPVPYIFDVDTAGKMIVKFSKKMVPSAALTDRERESLFRRSLEDAQSIVGQANMNF